jgi:hypothetical protein
VVAVEDDVQAAAGRGDGVSDAPGGRVDDDSIVNLISLIRRGRL